MPRKQYSPSRRANLKLLGIGAAGTLVYPLIGCGSGTKSDGQADAAVGSSVDPVYNLDFATSYPYSLPELPYTEDAFPDVIDARTMNIHYSKHHQGYTSKLNAAVESFPELQESTIFELLTDLDLLPEEARIAIQNNGGGYLNHALFWPMLSPDGGGTPVGELATAITETFGSFETFRDTFSEAAGTVFGSGWAWLVRNGSGNLEILQTENQDSPVSLGKKPVLGIDVWEHAYYLKYQNMRGDYISNFWNIVDWNRCNDFFAS